VLLVRSIRGCTAPRLLSADLPLFQGIVHDVFPGLAFSERADQQLRRKLEDAFAELGQQALPGIVGKALEFFETQQIRHGVMLVGAAMSGKSSAWRALSLALNAEIRSVETHTLNPKAVSTGELYGEFNPATSEWADGILSHWIRLCSFAEQSELTWIIVDGPVDSSWIESMNSLLDDNKVLCLPNNERIQFGANVRMVFEVGNLAHASPATVSRCGMVAFDQTLLPWKALLESWGRGVPDRIARAVA
jgi:hypothetical protein